MRHISTIPTFIINLSRRIDRKESILAEFSARPEFEIHLVEPIPDKLKTTSLWLTVKQIIRHSMSAGYDFVLLIEDDHVFTDQYNAYDLGQHIRLAAGIHADILCGGLNSVKSTFCLSPNLYWIEQFTGLQFTIIFRKCYSSILESPFNDDDCADIVISNLAKRKVVVHPFISVQKDFGYSDVTVSNNKTGLIDKLFIETSERIQNLKNVADFYKDRAAGIPAETNYDSVYIPTYVLHDFGNENLLKHIQVQFGAKPEYDLTLIDRSQGNDKSLLVRSIIETATKSEDEIIIIVSDTITFSADYDKHRFIHLIIQAHQLGAALLLGNTFGFDSAVFLTSEVSWVNSFSGSDMLILFKPIYQAILNDAPDRIADGSDKLSALTSHKMVIYPFVIQPHPLFAADDLSFSRMTEQRLAHINSEFLIPDRSETPLT